jgi:hypothetical protein
MCCGYVNKVCEMELTRKKWRELSDVDMASEV